MADLDAVDKTMDEILARQKPTNELTVASLDADAIWANFNKGKPTPIGSASTLPAPVVDAKEVKRRLGR